MNPVRVQYAIYDGKIFVGRDSWGSDSVYTVSQPSTTQFMTSIWDTREEAEKTFLLATPSEHYPDIRIVKLLTYVEDENESFE